MGPSGRVERLLVPHNLREQRHVRKGLGADRSLSQHGNVIIVTRIPIRNWFLWRAVVFGVQDRRFLPEGPLGEEGHDCNVALRNQMGKFFSNKRPDREAIMGDKFRMGSQLQNHLRNDVVQALVGGRRVTKSNHVRVLRTEI